MDLEFSNAHWTNPEHPSFAVDFNHPVYGWISFTANPNDPEEFGRNVFNLGLNGDIPVKEFNGS